MGMGRTPDKVLIYDPITDGGNYFEIGADGHFSEALYKDDKNIGHNPIFHPLNGCLIGFRQIKDWVTYDYFDPLFKKINEAIASQLDESSYGYPVCYAEDPRQLVIYVEAKDDAGSYYYMDLSIGKIQLIASNYDSIPTDWISKKQPISYKAGDGILIHGYLTLPPHKDAKNLALIVLPHGGPRARDMASYNWQVQCLAACGYAVLQPNFRGSTGYGSDYMNLGNGEWGRKMQTDLSDGVRYLVNKGLVDAKRVAIMGASYGGYAALAGATLDQGIYNCAIDIAGVSDLKDMIEFESDRQLGKDNPIVRNWMIQMGDKTKYDDISPAKQAAKAYCPILIIHGKDDTVVPIEQSERMMRALKNANKVYEYIDYKGQDHWETVESSRIDMMKHCLEFLAKYNPA